MATCFRCGREIPPSRHQLRRKVKTGEWLRRTYKKDRVTNVNVHYGMRVVCKSCAYDLDRESRIGEMLQYWELALALAVLGLILTLRLFG